MAATGIMLAVALFVPGSAQAGSGNFSRLSVEDGLSQSSVESIGEDRYGFLWFGTQEGLNRFDGYEFTVHQPSQRPGYLTDGFIRAIAADPRGNLWIGTGSGLQHLDVATGRFSESVAPPGIGVRLNTVRVAPDGRVWFAARGNGLWTLPPAHGARAQPAAVDGLNADALVHAVELDSAGNLWIAAGDHLFALRIDERNGTAAATATPALRDVGLIRVIHAEGAALWLAPEGAALLRFDPTGGVVTEYPGLPRSILTIASAADGQLWIGGKGAGLTRFDPETRETVTYRHEPGNERSLAEDDVAVVHEDRGGSLWAGAWNGGLSRLNLYSQAFRTLRNTPGQPDSLPDDDVTRMAEGPDGKLWSITRNDVLSVGDARTGSFVTIPLEGDLTAIGFAGSALFVGTATGLVEIDANSRRIVALRDTARAAGLDQLRIDALAGGDGHLWIVAEGTLYRLPAAGGGALQRVSLPSRMEPTSLHEASPERLWITFEDGILLRADLKGGALMLRRIGDASVSARGRLTAVAEHGGVVWLGAALGLGRLGPDGGSVEWIEPETGMPSRSVGGILVDHAGVLWIPTNRGITRFDPAKDHTVHFGAVQGAQASGYVDGGVVRGDSGLFYLAGRGITIFDPRQVVSNPHPPRVAFSALEILHRPVLPSWVDAGSPLKTAIHAANEVTLEADADVFSVSMTAPGVADPGGVHFFHRLDGFDEEWIETDADRRVATYTRLAPGRYVLRARARTQSGVWSADEARLVIRILPPWWRTPPATAIWIAIVILAVVALVRDTRSRMRVRVALAEQDALRRASVTDPLTGLYNRRFLTEWLKHEVPRTLRTHRSPESAAHREFLLFVLADLDNLKEINDRFGHDAGDRALLTIAALLETHARLGDIAVRLGGDEFVLVLRSIHPSHAAQVVERLRASVETLGGDPEQALSPTISLGFASFPFLPHDAEALTWEQTLQIADRALLHTKRHRRNAWTGFLSTPAASESAILDYLDADTERSPSTIARVLQGP